MKHIFTTIICLLLLVPVVAAQESTLTLKEDGSGSFTIWEEGCEPVDCPLSPKAVEFVIPLGLEEVSDAMMQGRMSYTRLYGSDESVAVYQAALGMTADQVTQLAKKQSEMGKSSMIVYAPILERLSCFDALSPEEVSSLGNDFRSAMQNDLEVGQTAMEEILTPDQFQRMRELELALGVAYDSPDDVLPLINLEAFNALDLSEEQEKELKKIQKENSGEINDFMKRYVKEILDKAVKGQSVTEQDMASFAEEGAAMKERILNQVLNRLLTPEQSEKFVVILEDWTKKLEQLKADWLAKQQEKKPEDDAWKKSWKPGDPLPEGAVPPKQPRKAFPFGG